MGSGSALASLAWPERQDLLPHHARNNPGAAARRLYVLFQETVRLFADVSRAGKSPGAAFVVVGAGRLAGLVVFAILQRVIAVVAAGAVDRGFDRTVARLDDAGAAHAGTTAIILDAGRHAILQPAHRAAGDIGRIVEAPRPAAPVALAHQRAIGGIPRGDGRVLIVAARAVEIGLGQRRRRGHGDRQQCGYQQTRPEQAASPHTLSLSTGAFSASMQSKRGARFL